MKRFIDQELKKWKESKRRKPLILRGARQVGKTYSLRQFGQDYFDSVALVDLERNPDWHRVFNGNLQANRICADLEILLKQKIIPGKTLLKTSPLCRCITHFQLLAEGLIAAETMNKACKRSGIRFQVSA